MTVATRPVSGGASRTDAPRPVAIMADVGPFVINLCSSTTPMALSHPQTPELRRFTFFVSRRLEDRRERFRLHMGYFETLQEAEEWLGVVREVYPGAWAGETPGKRLRERLAAEAAEAAAARAPAPAPAPKAVAAPVPAHVPTLQAAPAPKPAAVAKPAPVVRTAPVARPAVAHKPVVATKPVAAAKPAAAAKPTAAPRAVVAPRPVAAPKPAVHPAPARKPAAAHKSATTAQSNMRSVLASLDDSGHTRQMPAISSPAAATRAAPAAPAAPTAPTAPVAAATPAAPLSDTQVLRILERRKADGGPAPEDSSIALLKPDDTGTRWALKEAVQSNAPVSFAVQLQWSVQPIEIGKVPPLAIFSAYTLYTVEGSREGRRWYGLRLGFFSDAISAKQVAHYVRSEFNSVAVVPVSPTERGRASDSGHTKIVDRPAATSAVQDRLPSATAEFKLIDDVIPAAPVPAPRAAAAKPAPAPQFKRSAKPAPGRVRAKEKRSSQTLEQTLEILGADQLEIDNGRGERINDSGVRHLKVEVQKDSPFSRLLERLSERSRAK